MHVPYIVNNLFSFSKFVYFQFYVLITGTQRSVAIFFAPKAAVNIETPFLLVQAPLLISYWPFPCCLSISYIPFVPFLLVSSPLFPSFWSLLFYWPGVPFVPIIFAYQLGSLLSSVGLHFSLPLLLVLCSLLVGDEHCLGGVL